MNKIQSVVQTSLPPRNSTMTMVCKCIFVRMWKLFIVLEAMNKITFLLLALTCIKLSGVTAFFDPITIGLTTGAALGLYNFNTIKCSFTECCNHENIPGNTDRLKHDLSHSLFGQHIVINQLIPALQAHYSGNRRSSKPLVISFHGTPGTGKNFVADKIASVLYKQGLKSKFVHKYMGRADFPVNSDADHYNERIIREVRAAISECPRSLFIFDEVDKMPPKTFESLASLVNYHSFVSGADNTQSVFIFLSNTAGVQIAETLGKLLDEGTLRENTKISQFEPILEATAYHQKGGLKKTSLIEAHVIDHFIPFLPMEKTHIRKCLEVEFRKWGRHPKDDTLDEIINHSVTYDRRYGIFATSGCKKLEKKVAVEVNYRY